MSAALSLILPGCDMATLSAQARADGVLWARDDATSLADQDRLACLLTLFRALAILPGRVPSPSEVWADDTTLPSRAVIAVLMEHAALLRPVCRAAEGFDDLLALRGAALAQTAFTFLGPVLELFLRAVAHGRALRPVSLWLDQVGTGAALQAALVQDTAAWAVLSGKARIVGRGAGLRIVLMDSVTP